MSQKEEFPSDRYDMNVYKTSDDIVPLPFYPLCFGCKEYSCNFFNKDMENLKEWARKQKMDKWILEEQKRNRLAYEFKQEAKKRFPDLYPDTKDQVCKC